MTLYDNDLYQEDLEYVRNLDLPWEKLQEKSVLLSGATGLIGSFLVDVLLNKNEKDNLNCRVYALGRNEQRAMARFFKYAEDKHFSFVPYDVNLPFVRDDIGRVDYVLHLASNTQHLLVK